VGLYPYRRQVVRSIRLVAGVSLLCGLAAFTAQSSELRVCLDADAPPYSIKRGEIEEGFDLSLAKALALRLNRSLRTQWFESEFERESSLARDVNALLSADRCDVVSSYPLVAGGIGPARMPLAPLPRLVGGGGGKRSAQVRLGTLIVSRAYQFIPLEVIVGADHARLKIGSLDDLAGLRLGAAAATLGGAILLAYDKGRYAKDVVSLPVGGNVLAALEEGQFDAVLIERHRFDAYRQSHSETKLVASGYRHPLGFNMGFAALAHHQSLVEDMNKAIATMLEDDTLSALARNAGMTFVPPRAPELLGRITPAMLEKSVEITR
jgi:ABC-type amino acid transport substrate-binding protein